jgi:hypothetical protein
MLIQGWSPGKQIELLFLNRGRRPDYNGAFPPKVQSSDNSNHGLEKNDTAAVKSDESSPEPEAQILDHKALLRVKLESLKSFKETLRGLVVRFKATNSPERKKQMVTATKENQDGVSEVKPCSHVNPSANGQPHDLITSLKPVLKREP